MSLAIRNCRAAGLGVAFVALAVVSTNAAGPALQKGGSTKTVFAIALDSDDKPVTDMTKSDWAVREDGTDRDVVDLKPATDPLAVELLVDTTNAIDQSVADVRAGLQAFVQKIFAGTAPVTMTVFDVAGSEILAADNKKDEAEVEKAVTRTIADRTGSPVMLEAIQQSAKRLAKATTPRRIIVVVNLDGVPEASSLDAKTVISGVVASGASLWVVTYGNNATKNMGIKPGSGSGVAASGMPQGGIGTGNVGQNRDIVLSNVPGGTGGVRVMLSLSSGLSETLTRFAAVILSQYAVTYARPEGPLPKVVQMGSRREGVKIGYPSTPIK
jgi:hypothetical protein